MVSMSSNPQTFRKKKRKVHIRIAVTIILYTSPLKIPIEINIVIQNKGEGSGTKVYTQFYTKIYIFWFFFLVHFYKKREKGDAKRSQVITTEVEPTKGAGLCGPLLACHHVGSARCLGECSL